MYNALVLKNGQIFWLSQAETDAINTELDNGARFIKLDRFQKRLNVDQVDSVGIHPCFYAKVLGEFPIDPVYSNGIIYSVLDNIYYSFTGEKWEKDFYENYKRGTLIADLIPE
jgi:hypothetical protein